jgi:hypothetical protein
MIASGACMRTTSVARRPLGRSDARLALHSGWMHDQRHIESGTREIEQVET